MNPCDLRKEFLMAASYVDFKRAMSKNFKMEKTRKLSPEAALVMTYFLMENTCTLKCSLRQIFLKCSGLNNTSRLISVINIW